MLEHGKEFEDEYTKRLINKGWYVIPISRSVYFYLTDNPSTVGKGKPEKTWKTFEKFSAFIFFLLNFNFLQAK